MQLIVMQRTLYLGAKSFFNQYPCFIVMLIFPNVTNGPNVVIAHMACEDVTSVPNQDH
jgi:hypothetical protein